MVKAIHLFNFQMINFLLDYTHTLTLIEGRSFRNHYMLRTTITTLTLVLLIIYKQTRTHGFQNVPNFFFINM